MKFCPKCNVKLQTKKFDDLSGSKPKTKLILSCTSCDYSQQSKRIIIKEVSAESKPAIKVVDTKTEKLRSLPTTKSTCPKCRHNFAYFWDKQTSSLEQASTQFFRCVSCSHTWRAN